MWMLSGIIFFLSKNMMKNPINGGDEHDPLFILDDDVKIIQ